MRIVATGAAVIAASVTFGVASSTASAYVVRPGDTLTQIARRLGTTPQALAATNGLTDPNELSVGQVLQTPGLASPNDPGVQTASANAVASMSYTVRSGDTLTGIARRFGVTAAALQSANGISNPNLLSIGQVLQIPLSPAPGPQRPSVGPLETPGGTVPPPTTTTTRPPSGGRTYTVASGDTLYAIARRFGVTVSALQAANGITNPAGLTVGQVLVIPGTGPAPTNPPTTTPTTTPPPNTTPPPPVGPSSTPTLPVSLFGSGATDAQKLALVPSFDRWADAYQVPRDLLKGVGFVESGWNNNARSTSGAIGIGQLMPDTAKWVATTLIGDPNLDPTKADDNIRMMARYLKYLRDVAGDETRAIGSYYQGWGSVSRNGVQPATQTYIDRVLRARAAFA